MTAFAPAQARPRRLSKILNTVVLTLILLPLISMPVWAHLFTLLDTLELIPESGLANSSATFMIVFMTVAVALTAAASAFFASFNPPSNPWYQFRSRFRRSRAVDTVAVWKSRVPQFFKPDLPASRHVLASAPRLHFVGNSTAIPRARLSRFAHLGHSLGISFLRIDGRFPRIRSGQYGPLVCWTAADRCARGARRHRHPA